MKQSTIKIGTRGSQLALYQAELTKTSLENKFPELIFEIVVSRPKVIKFLMFPFQK